MKVFLLKCVLFLQSIYARAALALDRTRRLLLSNILLKGGRDMYLLTNGSWVDVSPHYSTEQITWCYNCELKTLAKPTDTYPHRTRRWDWLSVIADSGRDMSDFFSGLRISVGHSIAADKVLALFAYQNGWSPTGRLRILLRTGDEEVVDAITGHRLHHPEAAPRLPELNYIR